jgi:hypothetical protein
MLYFPLYILTGAENLEVNIETPIAQEKKKLNSGLSPVVLFSSL